MALCQNIDLERTPSSTRAARLRYTLEKAEIGAIILRIPLTTIYSEPLSITSRAFVPLSAAVRCAGTGSAGMNFGLQHERRVAAHCSGPRGLGWPLSPRRTLHVARRTLGVAAYPVRFTSALNG